MAYDYISIGTKRFDRQGYIGPTNSDYAVRVLHLSAVGSSSNAQIVISLMTGSPLTTVTNVANAYITMPLTDSGTNVTGEWDSWAGRLIEGPALLNTCAGFSYAVVEYIVLKK